MSEEDWIEELRQTDTDELEERFRQQEEIRKAVVAEVAADSGSTYPGRLPHGILVPAEQVADMVAVLVQPSDGCPNGSSFAVDADAADGQRLLQLSGVSARRLADHNSPTDPHGWLEGMGIELAAGA